MKFESYFRKATRSGFEPNGRTPYPYQVRFAESDELPQLLNVPTGIGKTATAILGWLYRRRFHPDERIRNGTPRRLVYCLPMRTLVEQTYACTKTWVGNLSLEESVSVNLLMGGVDDGTWDEYPERDAILIGTQDMLLSRALNRGYGMSRYRWPVHFGLLNNDCLWVLDEVQLMGSGLLTTAQLDLFGKKIWPRAQVCNFLWMSATLGEQFLNTRDRIDWEMIVGTKLELSPSDTSIPEVRTRLRSTKSIQVVKDCPKASKVLDEHASQAFGRLSLLIFNTVPSAKKMFADLQSEMTKPARKKKGELPEIVLVHGRFRPNERIRRLNQINSFVSRLDRTTGALPNGAGVVLVSTQVVEAGFDISSVRLWSEVAPWSSVVQRLGRLNREGLQPNAIATFWRPKEDKDRENKPDSPNAKRIGPYDKAAIDTCEKLLDALNNEMKNGLKYRDALDEIAQSKESQNALQVLADTVIRPDDMLELFGTDPDLAGGFTNVSQFVRDADRNGDVLVFWRDFSPKVAFQLDEPQPHRDELCSVQFFELRRLLGDKGIAWEWNPEPTRSKPFGAWERRRANEIWPGMTLLLPLSAGGYSDELGWTGDEADKPTLYHFEVEDCSSLADDTSSQTKWYPLPDHLADVEAEITALVDLLQQDAMTSEALKVAARWHDLGKSLPRWQAAALKFVEQVQTRMRELLQDPEAERFYELIAEYLPHWSPPTLGNGHATLWAKFPDLRDVLKNHTLNTADRKSLRGKLRAKFSPRLRHEAASALAAWDAWHAGNSELSAISVFLIAAHHGRVRTVLRATQENDEIFGLKPEDNLQPVPGFLEQKATLRFEAKHLGAHGQWNDSGTEFQLATPSWTEVMAELLGVAPGLSESNGAIPENELRSLGPFKLSYLEALLVAADVRASKKPGKSLGALE
jgi:CRISPR-associated endonuclease/helicase Cas3